MPFESPQAGAASCAASCAACGGALALPVRFCPFCGTAQEAAQHTAEIPVEAPALPEPATAPLVFHLEPGPAAAPPPRRAPDPDPPPAPSPLPRVATPPAAPKRRRIGRNRAALVLVALAALGAGVLAERAAQGPAQRPPAPPRASVEAGSAWAPVPLDRFRSSAAVTLSAEAPFALRLDGERVQRVQRSLRLPLRGLRRLEVRAARGSVRIAISGEAP